MSAPKVDPDKYSAQELQLLINDLKNFYSLKDQVVNQSYLLEFLRDLKEKGCSEKWINLRNRKALYTVPKIRLPIMINHKNHTTRIIFLWRLKINK